MKKLLTGLFLSGVLATSLFAQDGTYLCFEMSIIDGDKRYNLTEKQMEKERALITIDNHVLSDGHDKFIYLFTEKGIDFFKNDKHQMTFAIQTMPEDGVYFASTEIKDGPIIKFGCKKIK